MSYARWGYKIKVTTIGMWGHDAYSEMYSFSGQRGHFPNAIYRFTQSGEGSVHKDKYNDLEIKDQNFKVGYTDGNHRIDLIITEEHLPA